MDDRSDKQPNQFFERVAPFGLQVSQRHQPARLDGFGVPFKQSIDHLALVAEVVDDRRVVALTGGGCDLAE